MWFVLKDEDHPDAPKMVKKGWVIGIILTIIPLLMMIPILAPKMVKKGWVIGIVLTIIPLLMMIPILAMIPMTSTGGFDQQPIQENMGLIPEPVERTVVQGKPPESTPQQAPEQTQRQNHKINVIHHILMCVFQFIHQTWIAKRFDIPTLRSCSLIHMGLT
jgi:hypothetical protein